MSKDSNPRIGSRRTYLKAIGVGVTAGLAGCTSNDGNDGNGGTDGNGDSGGDGGDGGGGTATGTPGGNTVEEVVIGANHPLSGFLGAAGQAMTNAGKLATMHVNEEGGIESLGGAQLTFVSRDNKGTQEEGGPVEQQLIEEDGAHVVTGCYSSPVTLAATQVAERAGVPHIIDVSVANSILQGRGLNYAYRIQTPASGMAGDYARFMPELARANDVTMDTASIVYLDNAFGQSIRDTLMSALPEQNVEVLEDSAYTFGQESMDTEATRVKQADADAFIFVGYGGGGIRMMQSLQNVDYRPPLLTGTSTPTFTDNDIIKQIGKFANGGFGNNYQFDFNKEQTNKIFADYRREFGRELGVTHAAMTYSVVKVVQAALEEAGSADPEDINETLKTITVEDHPAAMPPIEFQENGENANALSPMFQVQNLEGLVVWPERYAQSEAQF
ncbi:ABC transporter substrate-binding protein [Salinirubellus salinus]|uniref:ABC transporter substrate-binding protein n=1 Tax=Salinirubellus salinus TaxID=1364945 RepID=A0A9E7R2D5_9EURY|nr:ABC transporter substrate-binding protein [Salinirubellus salinus]UWM54501.1 ABC transporter substrate-binding protein [Salinirubellus salinus]